MVYFGLSVSMTVVWLVLAVSFLIVEALTAGLTTIWFAAGAFAALICSLFDLALGIQIAVFLIVSICLLVFTRKIFVDELKTGTEKTNQIHAIEGVKLIVSPAEVNSATA